MIRHITLKETPMRRHMKLVRLLLEHAEAQCNGHWYNPPELKDYGASEVESR